MSELNRESSKKNLAKRTFWGLLIFAIICIGITSAFIYMELERRTVFENKLSFDNETSKEEKLTYTPLKLTDRAESNSIKIEEKNESYGEEVYYDEYSGTSIKKLEIKYIEISGLKDKKIQDNINQKISNKIEELKEKFIALIDDKDVDTITISAYIKANFSDVLSILFYTHISYDYNDEDYENDTYEYNEYGMNLSLLTGEEIKFKDLFWENSPVKTILSQSLYKSFAWDYAYKQSDENWDWNMDNLDYSGIESRVYNFICKYTKNPDIDFYFSTKDIFIIADKGIYYTINMADFYEYIAIYTKYKANSSLYETELENNEFYVFAFDFFNTAKAMQDSSMENNVYYTASCYDNIEELTEEGKQALDYGKKQTLKLINEYIQKFKSNTSMGYIIDAIYMEQDYEGKYGYSIGIEVASCQRQYLEDNLEEILAAGARQSRIEISANNYAYVDGVDMEFYESYYEYMEDYTDENTFNTNTYTKEDRLEDMRRWEEDYL